MPEEIYETRVGPLRAGDSVRLKSGGPVMTVDGDFSPSRVWCKWFQPDVDDCNDYGTLCSSEFHRDSLKKVPTLAMQETA